MARISLNDNQTNTNKVLLCINFCLLVLRSYQFFWTVPWFLLRGHPLLCWQGKRSRPIFLYEIGRIQGLSAFFSQQMDVWQSLGVLSWIFSDWFKGTKSMLGYHPLCRTAVVAYWSDCPGTSVLDGVPHFLASGSSWVAVWYQVCSSRLLLSLRGYLHLFFIKPTLMLFLTAKNLDDCISVWLLQMDSAFIYHYSGKTIHEIRTSISYFWSLN